ncbi:MBL fold metallo-hydrolase [Planotetraspora silvatica]|uniref:MBL fold metallo-hydrolase n=1 Tax=Planotetraspora silvatica TaxID=234614 RepID=UPI003570C8CF
MGYDPADVRHIVVTHLDVDHCGGLPDFPPGPGACHGGGTGRGAGRGAQPAPPARPLGARTELGDLSRHGHDMEGRRGGPATGGPAGVHPVRTSRRAQRGACGVRQVDPKRRVSSQEVLRSLANDHGVAVFSAHDPWELAEYTKQ